MNRRLALAEKIFLMGIRHSYDRNVPFDWCDMAQNAIELSHTFHDYAEQLIDLSGDLPQTESAVGEVDDQ